MHPNAAGMAAFTLVSNLAEMLVAKDVIAQAELNALLEKCAVLNESLPRATSTTNADAATLLRQLMRT